MNCLIREISPKCTKIWYIFTISGSMITNETRTVFRKKVSFTFKGRFRLAGVGGDFPLRQTFRVTILTTYGEVVGISGITNWTRQDGELLVIYIYAKRSKRRRKWVHDILKECSKFGECHYFVKQLFSYANWFFWYFQMVLATVSVDTTTMKDDVKKKRNSLYSSSPLPKSEGFFSNSNIRFSSFPFSSPRTILLSTGLLPQDKNSGENTALRQHAQSPLGGYWRWVSK